jgi:hypothetical protein
MGCVWPANYRNSCGLPVRYGHICSNHLQQVREMAGTLACGWPGCNRRDWDCKGLCDFHRRVAFGLFER